MNKFFIIVQHLLEICKAIFGTKTKKANTSNENLKNIKSGLEAAPKTEEVKAAQKKIEYLETLPEKEIAKKDKEIAEIQEIVEKEVKAKPITEDRAKSLLKKYKNNRNS